MNSFIKKTIIVCMLVILVAIMMTGCFPTTEDKPNSFLLENSSNNQNDAREFPTYIEDMDIEKLTIKENVNFPDKGTIPVLTTTEYDRCVCYLFVNKPHFALSMTSVTCSSEMMDSGVLTKLMV